MVFQGVWEYTLKILKIILITENLLKFMGFINNSDAVVLFDRVRIRNYYKHFIEFLRFFVIFNRMILFCQINCGCVCGEHTLPTTKLKLIK